MLKRRILFVAIGLFQVSVLAAQTRLVLPEIAGLITVDGSGSYQKVLEEAAKRAGLQFSVEIYPKARALSLFLAGGYEGIFTYTQTARDKLGKENIIASYPFGAYRGYVFTSAGAAPISDFKQLNGKLIGGMIGFEGTYDVIKHSGALLNLVSDDSQNIGMLGRGRIFAMLGFLPDLYAELPRLSYDPDHPFFESYDRLTMKNTPDNRSFLTKLSAALSAMHHDGTVHQIVGPAYLAVRGDFSLDK